MDVLKFEDPQEEIVFSEDGPQKHQSMGFFFIHEMSLEDDPYY